MQALNFSQVQTLAFAGGGNRCWWQAGLLTQLQAYKSGARKNDAMSVVAPALSDQDIEDLAAYYSAIEISIGKLPGG